MMIRIPQEKINNLKLLLQPLLHKKKMNVKQLESLTDNWVDGFSFKGISLGKGI